MDQFNFTEKKYISLSEKGRHRHLMSWLSRCYHQMRTNRVSSKDLHHFTTQYQQFLNLGKMPGFAAPENTTDTRLWLEAVSDAIHYHRTSLGIRFHDHMGFENQTTGDKQKAAKVIDCHFALDGLRSVFNIGSIIRNCEAAGFSSIILGNCPGSENQGVRKTAMGSEKWIRQRPTDNLVTFLAAEKEKGYQIAGIETVEKATPFDCFHWQEKTIIVLGNEEYGISSHVLKSCDSLIKIPMYGHKNSINVASAAAIICMSVAQALAVN